MPPPAPTKVKPVRLRWVARLTTALLAASLGVLAGAATPAFLRAAGVKLRSEEPPASAAPLALPHRPPELLSHEGPEGLFDPDDDEAPPSHGQLGLAREKVALHEQPATVAPEVGDVEAGEMVTILRVVGEWALVYSGGDGGNLVVGWVRKSEIAVR